MNRLTRFRYVFPLSCLVLSLSAQASTLYRCVEPTGVTLYTNQKSPRGTCTVLSVQVPPAPKQGVKAAGSAGGPVSGASKNPSPADFPRVADNEQKARDTDRRSILENEMNNERNHLDAARRQLAESAKGTGAPPQLLRDTIALHERNIEALTKEMSKLR
jgi:hypothetical protein